MKEAVAFSPGHITGFFQICDHPSDPLMVGSRGAGVSITHGVTTRVQIKKAAKTSFRIKINDGVVNSAPVSEHVLNAFLPLVEGSYNILVEHNVEIPIGCGFGSSGAGALSLAFALNEVFNLGLSRFEAAQIAHVAEVKCKTGLGTVIAETFGGLEIRVKPGAPGVGEIKSIPVNEELVVACLSYDPVSTKKILTDHVFRQRINEFGGKLIDELVKHPTVSNFMEFSREFAEHLGLISGRVRKVLQEMDSAGLACSMAMLGESVFSIINRDQVEEAREIFNKHTLSKRDVIIADIDFKGARLL